MFHISLVIGLMVHVFNLVHNLNYRLRMLDEVLFRRSEKDRTINSSKFDEKYHAGSDDGCHFMSR